MPTENVHHCAAALAAKKWRIAFVESATAGRASADFSLTKHSGDILLGGICCYDPCVKEKVLAVPPDLIEQYTAESAEVTKALADGAKKHFDADVIVAITGLTTPGGSETDGKPVGTMFFHILLPEDEIAHRQVFEGGPEYTVIQAIDKAAQLIENAIAS